MRVLKLNPLLGFLIVVALCHGGMWTVAFVLEHRVLDWTKQYYGFVYGDLVLAAGFAAGLWANQHVGLPSKEHWSQRLLARTVAKLVVVSIAVWRWALNDYPVYSVGQNASPSKLYHDLLFAFVGYLILKVVLPLVTRSWWVLLPLAAVAGWACIGIFLDFGVGWKTAYAHVDFNWPVKDFVAKYLDPLLRRR